MWAVMRGSEGSDDKEANREQTDRIKGNQPPLVDHFRSPFAFRCSADLSSAKLDE
jgi:hypothetical protein